MAQCERRVSIVTNVVLSTKGIKRTREKSYVEHVEQVEHVELERKQESQRTGVSKQQEARITMRR